MLTIGTRGEIVIPKKIREQLGLVRGRKVLMSVKGDAVELRAAPRDVIKEMEECAKEVDADVSAWKMGDELYEEIF